jgi:putative transposase
MRYTAHRHHGRPPRLANYDYSAPGVYFLTLCSWGRLSVFGKCESGAVELGEWGRVLEEEWLRTPRLRPYVRLDAYVIMPDHLHGIVIWDRDPFDPVGPQRVAGLRRAASMQCPYSLRLLRRPRSVGSFVARFKAICTKRINELRGKPEPPVWQRNYYEHVIRNRKDLERIRRYVLENPYRWAS